LKPKLLTTLLLLSAYSLIAQVETNLPYENNDIAITANEFFCPSNDVFDQEQLLISITNTSNEFTKKISWDAEIWVDGACVNCNGYGEYHYSFVVWPNESLSGVCFEQNNYGLSYFIRFNDTETTISNTTTKVIFKNITVENIN
jgi:hypothetical protein